MDIMFLRLLPFICAFGMCLPITLGSVRALDPTSHDLIMERLIGLAEDPDPRVRFRVALALGEVESPRRLEALAKIARRDCEDRWVRTAILSAVDSDADNLLADLMAIEGAPPNGLVSLVEALGSIVGARSVPDEIVGIVRFAAELRDGGDGLLAAASLRGLASGIRMGEGVKPVVPGAADSLKALCSAEGSPNLSAAAAKLEGLVDLGETTPGSSLSVAELLAAAHGEEGHPDKDRERLARLANLVRAKATTDADWEGLQVLLLPSETDEFLCGLLEQINPIEDIGPHAVVLRNYLGLGPSVRKKALEVIFARRERVALLLHEMESGRIAPNKLDAERRAQLLNFPDPEIARRAGRLMEKSAPTDGFELYERLRPALELEGNPARGVEIHKMRCMQCHRAGGVGYDVGPNWAGLKSSPPDTLLLNLLYPSLNILPGFTQYVVELNNGRLATGIIAASTPSSIVLRRGGGEEETILRRNIRRMSDTALSIMPEGLADGLSGQELADLIAFIKASE